MEMLLSFCDMNFVYIYQGVSWFLCAHNVYHTSYNPVNGHQKNSYLIHFFLYLHLPAISPLMDIKRIHTWCISFYICILIEWHLWLCLFIYYVSVSCIIDHNLPIWPPMLFMYFTSESISQLFLYLWCLHLEGYPVEKVDATPESFAPSIAALHLPSGAWRRWVKHLVAWRK